MDRLRLGSRLREEGIAEQKQPFVEHLLNNEQQCEPTIDAASSTRTCCIAAVATGAVLALFCLISGIYILCTKPTTLGVSISISPSAQEVLALAINVLLALCTDGMMFVHSVSLRWALYREGRLEFNTNIRLLTSSRKFGPNRWYINLVALACLVLTYASSSVLFLSDLTVPKFETDASPPQHRPVLINGTALVALGLGLTGQAAIAIWCLASSCRSIPTWSSNPLNTALAVSQKGDLVRRPGRCMLSVHQRHMSSEETYPLKRQGNMLRVQGAVRYILALLWSLALLAIAWPIAIATVSRRIGNDSAAGQGEQSSCWRSSFDWTASEGACSRNDVTLAFSPYANSRNLGAAEFSYAAEAVLCVLFVCLIQASQTIALHCIELLVSLSRDEGVWRQAYSEKGKGEAPGTQLATNAVRAAVSSWENAAQFVAKALLHWIIGQSLLASVAIEDTKYGPEVDSDSVVFKRGFQFDMVYSRLIVYGVLAVLVAVFATYLALNRPRGCQPAALGHLQTLIDLVDDWKTDEDGRMWWGDKTRPEDSSRVRHAGTACDKAVLGPICTSRYAG
jgi:hypothetical protein